MIEYTITFARSARKELEDLDAAIVHRVFPKIEALAKEPRPPGCRKVQGEKFLWRIRVGDYRQDLYNHMSSYEPLAASVSTR